MDAEEILHKFIYIDEAGFNLTKVIIGHRSILNVPGQCGANTISLCTAIAQNGVLHHHANIVPYNTALVLTFLDRLHSIVTAVKPNRPDAIHCQQGLCIFPLVSSGLKLVSSTSPIYSPTPFTILPLPKPHQRVFLHMAVEGL